uniref:Uncharacterized protein n=1 Tax=Physcomitrium patens TaxID=3218 RepID=A0A2K1IX66_PHYPA|nr:hypothetical protein PHYPA_023680 [Physcomitrium patens]
MVRDRFLERIRGISLLDWELMFQIWMKEKHQRSPTFNECGSTTHIISLHVKPDFET